MSAKPRQASDVESPKEIPAQERDGEAGAGIAQTPLSARLTYVRQMLVSLNALLREQELTFLRYLLTMAADEAQTHAKRLNS